MLRAPGLVVVLLSVLAVPAVAIGQPAAETFEGVRPEELLTAIGPATRVMMAGDATTQVLRYETSRGPLVYYSRDGRVSHFAPVRELQSPPGTAQKRPKNLSQDARKLSLKGDHWGAAALISQCFRIAPADRDCFSTSAAISTTYWSKVSGWVDVAPEAELADVREFIVALLTLNPTSPVLTAGRKTVEQRYLALTSQRVAAARSLYSESQLLLPQAEEALSRGDYSGAIKVLESVRGNERADVIRQQARGEASKAALEAVAEFERNGDHTQFPAVLSRIGDVISALDIEQTGNVRDAALSALRTVVVSRLGITPTDASVARGVQEVLAREAGIQNANMNWAAVLGHEPRLIVEVAVLLQPSCVAGISKDDVLAVLQRAAPSTRMGEQKADMHLNARVDCRVTVSKGAVSEVPSAYRAGTNQMVNSDYAQLQTQLQAAQVHLAQVRLKWALNPPANGWAGFAKGLEEGAAEGRVRSLTNQLLETAAFIEQPVEAPYIVTQIQMTKAGAVVIDVEVTAPQTKRIFATQLQAVSEATSREVTGAMPTDQRGNRNAAAEFLPDGRFYSQALGNARAEDLDTIRGVLREALLGIADATPPGAEGLQTLGTVLLAIDSSSAGDVLPEEYAQALSALRRASLDNLRTLKVDIVRKPAVAALAARPSPSPTVPRAEMVKTALDAVVTIETASGSGSGFFISSTGDLITNAHVVDGADRIRVRTSSKDVYLATVVKIDTQSDVALLRVSGYSGPFLVLAETDDAAVGTDITAVGSPLGLEGTVTRGIISARRTLGGVPVVQIDAAINPGNSGGPLLAEDGSVIGVNSWKLRPERAESLGFAVAASAVRKVVAPYLR